MKIIVAILFAVLLVNSSNANVLKCFGDCAKKHLSIWEALKIIGTCKDVKECYFKELKGKALECAQQCLSVSKVEDEKFAQELLEEALSEKNLIKCFGSCAKKHLSLFEALRIVGTCKDVKECYLKELKGKALECAKQCLGGESVESTNQEKDLLKCFGECAKKHLSIWEALRIIGTCKQEKECYFKELKGKALECAQQCLSSSSVIDKVEGELEKLVDMNEEEKNLGKCLASCAKKHLSLSEAIKIIAKCKADKKCYLKELKGKALECVQQCVGFSSVNEEPSCEDTVTDVRKKFSDLNGKEKREFVEKVYKKLQEKHPEAEKSKIFTFVKALFSRLSPSSVCKLYDRMFKKADVDKIVDDYEKGIGSCLKSCAKKHLKLTTALKLIAKCNINKACYIANLAGKALECVKACI